MYIYISEASKKCSTGNYYTLFFKVKEKEYYIDFEKNEFLSKHVDTSNLNFTPLVKNITMICCEIKGYAFRFHKDEKGKYQLRELEHYYNYSDNFILEDDKEYFPFLEVVEEEPEPELPIEKEN